jgi:hypothetical protein
VAKGGELQREITSDFGGGISFKLAFLIIKGPKRGYNLSSGVGAFKNPAGTITTRREQQLEKICLIAHPKLVTQT